MLKSLAPLYHNIAGAYYQLDRFAEALPYYQKTLEIELQTLPDNASTIAVTYVNMATAFVGLKRYDEALKACQNGIDQLLKTLTPDHQNIQHQRAYMETVRKKQMLQSVYKK